MLNGRLKSTCSQRNDRCQSLESDTSVLPQTVFSVFCAKSPHSADGNTSDMRGGTTPMHSFISAPIFFGFVALDLYIMST
ncbi:hypothetical protein GB937_005965 [Aspergillus fischeri]|nr:hypothetical protein GB937_005965 [Aspergillus fischeri]